MYILIPHFSGESSGFDMKFFQLFKNTWHVRRFMNRAQSLESPYGITNNMRRTIIVLLSFPFAALLCCRPTTAQVETSKPVIIDVSGGTPINQMIRGYNYNVALPVGNPEWQSLHKIEEILDRTSARGPSEGGSSQTYDWRTLRDRQGGKGKTTLDFLRMMRDRNCEAIISVNMKGTRDGLDRPEQLAKMAADWLYYMNHTLTTYRQGDKIPPGRDKEILDSLKWGENDTLLTTSEPPLKKVKYYEIGNETGGKTPDPVSLVPLLVERYKLLSRAVLSEDPQAKVGPCGWTSATAYIDGVFADPEAQVDFACYHPYGMMANKNWGVYPETPDGDTAEIVKYLLNMKDRQAARHQPMVDSLRKVGRPLKTPFAITEWNPGPWGGMSWQWSTMDHALATCESIFIWAHYEEGPVFAASYFSEGGWLRSSTETPKFQLFETLRDHLGDYLVHFYNPGSARPLRVYVTRSKADDKVVIWRLNFSEDQQQRIRLQLRRLPFAPRRITLMKLGVKGGRDTRLLDYIPEHTPDAETPIGWTESDMTGLDLSDFTLTIEDPCISALLIEK